MHVFIRGNRGSGAVDHLGAQLVDGTHDSEQVTITEQTSPCENVRMDSCLREVVRRESPVEVRRQAQGSHRIRWPLGEPPTPQAC